MGDEKQKSLGWGVVDEHGAEIWDSTPVFLGDGVSRTDRLKLLFYPKKFLLYRYIERHVRSLRHDITEPLTIVDVGCGTGASVVDLKKLFGREVDVIGVDVVKMQIELAEQKLRESAVHAEVQLYDGEHLPFENRSVDVIYSSDVLGHVKDVRAWLREIHRVLKPDGVIAMFVESKLGKHAWIRNYMMNRGLNVDPHAEFHISLYSKETIVELFEQSKLRIGKMYSTVWAKFFVHPNELYPALQGQKKFFFLRLFNRVFTWIRKITHPVSTAIGELYSLCEMLIVGKWIESQGYIIMGRKR